MNKRIVAFLILSCLLSACTNLGFKEPTESLGGKFSGNHVALARCVVDKLQSDSRWVIRGLQYETWTYPGIAATEIYAYTMNNVPGIYARTSPDNPDAVGTYYGMPIAKTYVYGEKGAPPNINPNYSFMLTLKRTDNETVFANLNGKRYEGSIAWEKLESCAGGSGGR